MLAGDGNAVKVAVTDFLLLIVSSQTPVPPQAPDQPLKVEPAAGVAVNVTDCPLAYLVVQTPGQEMPDPLIVPDPVPARVTVSRRWGLATTCTSRVVE